MLALLLLQICVIAAAARFTGFLFQKLGQPRVAGEMTAGIALGPSLFGWLAPHLHASLFPESSLAALNMLGQLGLIFYMFVVGLSLNAGHLREQSRVAMASSVASIALPFVSGFGLAMALYHQAPLALFIGVCLSITAFPVLVRILDETQLLDTKLGAIATAAAAFGDVVAWLMLAGVLASTAAFKTIAWLALYIALMIALRFVWRSQSLAGALLIAVASALATEWIGVHALFGAFFAGVVIHKTPELIESARKTVEPLTLVFFLPVFFAFTGLRTRVDTAWNWQALAFLLAAVLGKWLGAYCAARWAGMQRREANALGILMNARGLVELVILTIGLDLKLITPEIFSMLVMMALVTTLMTTPLIRRFYSPMKASASISTSMSGSMS